MVKVELEFLDHTKTRIHEKFMEYNYPIPVPHVGEHVCVEFQRYRVCKRDFIYLDGGPKEPDLKISLWVEETERNRLRERAENKPLKEI
jgi:hypothetical protein